MVGADQLIEGTLAQGPFDGRRDLWILLYPWPGLLENKAGRRRRDANRAVHVPVPGSGHLADRLVSG